MFKIKNIKKIIIPILVMILFVAMSGEAFAAERLYICTSTNGVNIRSTPSTSAAIIGHYNYNQTGRGPYIEEVAYGDGYRWIFIMEIPDNKWGWVASAYFDCIQIIY